jgi:hypothetical protein
MTHVLKYFNNSEYSSPLSPPISEFCGHQDLTVNNMLQINTVEAYQS